MSEQVDITKEDFEAYVRVQMSGVTNMMNVHLVSELSGLDEDQVMEIIKHYGDYKEKFSNPDFEDDDIEENSEDLSPKIDERRGVTLAHGIAEHWSFFWDTDLSNERMQEISDWVGNLTQRERGMLDDLVEDSRKDQEFDTMESLQE